jgi:hypothetical protein
MQYDFTKRRRTMSSITTEAGRTRRKHRLLLILPFVWQAGLAPAVNNVQWAPLGLPFPMVWQLVGIVLTSVTIGIVYKIDQSLGEDDDGDRPLTRAHFDKGLE